MPLEERARLIGSATPRFARMIASKLAKMNCAAVVRDMENNHQRPLSKSYAQDLGSTVTALATVRTVEVDWKPFSQPKVVATVVVGVDGANIHVRGEGWRQSLAGTIALYDREGALKPCMWAAVRVRRRRKAKRNFWSTWTVTSRPLKADLKERRWWG